MRQFNLGVMLACAGLLLPELAKAQEAPFPVASHQVILWSARSCYAEATWSQADCTALLHVIRKRSAKLGWSFLKMLKAYSVKNWVQSGHGRAALTLQMGVNKKQSPEWNESWRKLVMHVVDVLGHRAEDPCPIADHWAARYYKPKSPMRRVKCEIGTANQFWVTIAAR